MEKESIWILSFQIDLTRDENVAPPPAKKVKKLTAAQKPVPVRKATQPNVILIINFVENSQLKN